MDEIEHELAKMFSEQHLLVFPKELPSAAHMDLPFAEELEQHLVLVGGDAAWCRHCVLDHVAELQQLPPTVLHHLFGVPHLAGPLGLAGQVGVHHQLLQLETRITGQGMLEGAVGLGAGVRGGHGEEEEEDEDEEDEDEDDEPIDN